MGPRRQRSGPSRHEGAATGTAGHRRRSLPHCEDCRCRCHCHRPPPEPPYTAWPTSPLPGEPFYMAAVAAGEISAEERLELERRVRAHTTPQRMVRRCRVVLMAAEGVPSRRIAPTARLRRGALRSRSTAGRSRVPTTTSMPLRSRSTCGSKPTVWRVWRTGAGRVARGCTAMTNGSRSWPGRLRHRLSTCRIGAMTCWPGTWQRWGSRRLRSGGSWTGGYLRRASPIS